MTYTNRSWAAKAAATLLGIALNCTSLWATPAAPQAALNPTTTSATPSAAQAPGVPRLVRFSGTANDATGKLFTGTLKLKVSFYAEQEGDQALWSEIQTVRADSAGHYTVLLGASEPDGLPNELFTASQARWVGVEPMLPGVGEAARVLLVGVPYALKAADSETLGGKPASDYVTLDALNGLASHQQLEVAGAPLQPGSQLAPSTISGSGVANYIPIWTSSTTLADSTIFEVGGKVGIGNTSPASTLDVSGGVTARGPLQLPALGTATPTTGFNSNPQDWFASSYNSTTHLAVKQDFRWMAEPVGNNSPAPLGKMNLLFGSNGVNPTETGLSINNRGQITFAAGQTLPAGSAVQSLNSLTGAVTLAAGSNISISHSGNTLTIASSGSTIVHDGSLMGTGTSGSPLGISLPLAINTTSASPVFSLNNANADALVGNSGAGDGVNGSTTAIGKAGVNGVATLNSSYGVLGRNTSDGSIGWLGFPGLAAGGVSREATVGTAGVYGASQQGAGIGVVDAAGVWGDSFAGDGMVATSNQNNGLVAATADSLNQFNAAAFLDNQNANPADPVLQTFAERVGGSCTITNGGDLACTGSKSAVVPVDNGSRMVTMYAVESPQNWFEDFGSGTLVGGSATISLEGVFAQTVNTGENYHVYLTPNGDCKGLYIAHKGAASFEVRELGGGTASISFDYRIVAERKGYESVRLADKTKLFDRQRLMRVVRSMQNGPANKGLSNNAAQPAGDDNSQGQSKVAQSR
jgi:hypothetical protein